MPKVMSKLRSAHFAASADHELPRCPVLLSFLASCSLPASFLFLIVLSSASLLFLSRNACILLYHATFPCFPRTSPSLSYILSCTFRVFNCFIAFQLLALSPLLYLVLISSSGHHHLHLQSLFLLPGLGSRSLCLTVETTLRLKMYV